MMLHRFGGFLDSEISHAARTDRDDTSGDCYFCAGLVAFGEADPKTVRLMFPVFAVGGVGIPGAFWSLNFSLFANDGLPCGVK